MRCRSEWLNDSAAVNQEASLCLGFLLFFAKSTSLARGCWRETIFYIITILMLIPLLILSHQSVLLKVNFSARNVIIIIIILVKWM